MEGSPTASIGWWISIVSRTMLSLIRVRGIEFRYVFAVTWKASNNTWKYSARLWTRTWQPWLAIKQRRWKCMFRRELQLQKIPWFSFSRYRKHIIQFESLVTFEKQLRTTRYSNVYVIPIEYRLVFFLHDYNIMIFASNRPDYRVYHIKVENCQIRVKTLLEKRGEHWEQNDRTNSRINVARFEMFMLQQRIEVNEYMRSVLQNSVSTWVSPVANTNKDDFFSSKSCFTQITEAFKLNGYIVPGRIWREQRNTIQGTMTRNKLHSFQFVWFKNWFVFFQHNKQWLWMDASSHSC